MGYYSAGFWGAVSQVLLFGFIISLSVIKPLQRFSKIAKNVESIRKSAEKIEESVDPRRLVFVRIQEPHALLLKLKIGGQMSTMTWQDVDCARYETYPEEALEQALEDYDGYRISHYIEQHPDVDINYPLKEIDEESWIEVVPERDLPQEEE